MKKQYITPGIIRNRTVMHTAIIATSAVPTSLDPTKGTTEYGITSADVKIVNFSSDDTSDDSQW